MANQPDREYVLGEITKEELRLSSLEKERARVQAKLKTLKAELASFDSESQSGRPDSVSADAGSPLTVAEKVALFRELFRGREDVYPTLWINAKTGRAGYSPTCSNEWVRGVCEKPRVKCGDCQNQAFLSVTNRVIVDHLQGRHVVGVYPLLKDETVWFLAADFDKRSWMEDVSAFVESCRNIGVPTAVERSRSGNGAHVWIFVTQPMSAQIARKMGCHLITETMNHRHQLSMQSYDRLFPNQDTMPRGGFGNLIALPLQHEPRQRGNTVFLNDQLEPVPDQWAYIEAIQRMTPAAVEEIVRDASRNGQVIGLRSSEIGDEGENVVPWTRKPSGRQLPLISEPLPKEIRGVLAQRLFVEKAHLPSVLLNQIKRLAAFQNPEFYKKQSMRLSTAITPRVINCAEEFPQHIALPRGCLKELEGLLGDLGSSLVVDDQRTCGRPLKLSFRGQLTLVQRQAADALIEHDMGVFVAPPGIGKTVLGTYLVAARGCSTLILVHRSPLLDQWIAHLSMFLGIESKAIGHVEGGKRKPNGVLDVAMIQSIVRKGQVDDRVAEYGHVIVDECHHVPAISFERVLSEVNARYVIGLTATPQRRDGHHPISHMQLGPIRFTVGAKSQAAKRPFAHRLIIRETAFKAPDVDTTIQRLYSALAINEDRNNLILDDVIGALEEGRSPLLLTERKDHLEFLAEKLCRFARHLVVLQGRMTAKVRAEVDTQLATIPDDEERLILATGRYIGEGFDDARLDTLFLAMPVSWKGTLIQYTGRLHRLHARKTEVRIVDYVDGAVPLLRRMFEKRLRGYRAMGYAQDKILVEDEATK
jgi:superfamily II DNA or RNA helicase